MKKLIWTLAILIVIAVFGGRAWYLYKQAKTEKDVVKIGVILPLTGPASRDREAVLTGIKTAVNEINNTHDLPMKIDIVVEDNKLNASKTVAAFHKINNSVSAFIIVGEVSIRSLLPLIKEHHKPTLVTLNSSDSPIYAASEIFRAWFSIHDQTKVIADYVKKYYPHDRIALMTIKNHDGVSFEKIFKTELDTIGQNLVANETFAIGDIDTKSQVAKILDKNPDVIVIYGYAQGHITVLNTLLEQRYNGIIITNRDIQTNYKLIANNAAGIYFETTEYDYSKLAVQAPNMKNNLFAAFGYEDIKILAHVIKEKGSGSAQICEGLANLKNFDSGFGRISYDKDGELYFPPFVIKQMMPDGTAKIIKE